MKTAAQPTRMKSLIQTASTGLVLLVITACASMTAPPPPSTQASGTVRIEQFSAAYYGSATTGKGSLNFRGQRHHFTISGVGAGGMGGQKVSASGKVYNLDRVSDFAGTYRGVSNGLTLIEGKMHAKLTNGNGVTMYLAGSTEGLASSMGVQAFQVSLSD